MTAHDYPPPVLRDREGWLIIGMILFVSLLCFPPWIRDKCAGEWRCGIGGGR